MLGLLILGLASSVSPTDILAYSGRDGMLEVRASRMEESGVQIDGRLDEEEWARASRLVDFTQYEPVEGIPSSEDTEILIFYTSDAIYFGIRARDRIFL